MDRETARQLMVRDTKRLAGQLEVGLCEAVVLRSFCDTMRVLPALLLERHAGLVGWTVFLLNRNDCSDEARAAGLSALRWYLDHEPDGEDAATWTENVRELLKANGEDVTAEAAREMARHDPMVPGTESSI